MDIYRSYRKIKTGVLLFEPLSSYACSKYQHQLYNDDDMCPKFMIAVNLAHVVVYVVVLLPESLKFSSFIESSQARFTIFL